MSLPKAEVRRYKKTSDGIWSSSYDSLFISGLDVSESLEANRDMFNLRVNNQNKMYSNFFGIDDRVIIYLYRNTLVPASDLVFDGTVMEISWDLESSGRRLTVRGSNRTHELLSSLILYVQVNNNTKVYEAIQAIIDQVNNNNQATASNNSQRFISYDSSSVVQVNSTGAAFTNKNFNITYKTAYDAISQLSTNEYTDDGDYIFYIDGTNKFHWTYKPSTIPSSTTFSEGVNCEQIQVQKGKWAVYNSVIADVGKDCYDHGNHLVQINPASVLSLGAKWKFLDLSSISKNLIEKQFLADTSKWNTTQDGSSVVRKENFPKGASYPFTMTFKEIDSNGQELGSSWSVSSDAQFNNAIRVRSRFDGRKRAIDFLRLKSEANYRASLRINGTLTYDQGNIATLTSPTANVTDLQIRIKQITHRFDNAGWVTSVDLEEDVE